MRAAAAALALGITVEVFAPIAAGAHGRSVSYSAWRIDGPHIDVSVRVADLDLSAVETSTATVPATEIDASAAYVARTVSVTAETVPCRPSSAPRSVSSENGWRTVVWTLECPAASTYTLSVDLLFAALPSHLHFARVDAAGRDGVERVITDERRTWAIAAAAPTDIARTAARGSTLGEYVALGIRHILSGYDHVAFVVALLLLAGTLREVAMLVSSFTFAHSLTLALAAFGVAHPNPGAIEALIGFSIALVAIENVWLLAGRPHFLPLALTLGLIVMAFTTRAGLVILPPLVLVGLALFCASHFSLMSRVRDATRLRAIVALCFGLAHGFGFAGVLSQISNDPARLVHGLLGFNAGVELGQLAIVALAWPLLVLAQRTHGGAPRILVAELGSAVVCGLGTFWFLVRAIG